MSRIYFKINSIFFTLSFALYHRSKGRCFTARLDKQAIIEHKDDFEFLKKFLPFPLKSTYDDWESHCEQFRFVLQFERDIDLKIYVS